MNTTDDRSTDALHGYVRLKLDLATIVRALLHFAETSKDDPSIRDCRKVLSRIAEDRFNLAIVGQFSRGKSSLMNALLGAEKVPTGILPLTSVITAVTYGETERVLLRREGWKSPQQIPLDQLPQYVTQSQNSGNEKRVEMAEIQLPHELLRLGVHFIDTPGVASSFVANTNTTRQFLPEADAAIFVTSFESPMTESELVFLREVREHVHKIFLVVNKSDLVVEADRTAVVDSLRQTLRELPFDSQPEIFVVSARQALAAKQSFPSSDLAHTGLPVLEASLSKFLRRDKAREFLLGTVGRAMRIARQMELGIQILRRAANREEAVNLEARLAEISSGLIRERDAKILAIRRTAPRKFQNLCLAFCPLWCSEMEAQIRIEIETWLLQARPEILGRAMQDFFQQTFQDLFTAWMDRHKDRVAQVFRDITQTGLDVIETLAGSISALPARVLAEAENIPSKSTFEIPPLAFRTLQMPLLNFEIPWWHELIPAGRVRTFLVKRWARCVAELGQIYVQTASDLFVTAMNDWIDAVKRDLGGRIDRMTERTRDLLSRNPSLAEMSELNGIIDRLQTFVKTVLRLGSQAPDFQPSLNVSAPPAKLSYIPPCALCTRLDDTLQDFLARRQYELAVNERDQRSHATRSGFCPFHTWQYEAISSPQGVCAAYSELLHLFAKRFQLLAQNETSVQAMEQGVRSMLPNQGSCLACQLEASTEKTLAREMARRLQDEDSDIGVICAFHLHSILMAAPGHKSAVRLLLKEARAFERMAENMQNHILKHEAIRHDLSTRAERTAPTDGLAHLVGSRGIASIRKID